MIASTRLPLLFRLTMVALALLLPAASSAQIYRFPRDSAGCSHEPLRSTLLYAGAGALFAGGGAALQLRPITRDKYLPIFWGTYSAAFLAGSVAHAVALSHCPQPSAQAVPDGPRASGGAAWRGSGIGTWFGASGAFMASPLLVGIIAIPMSLGGRHTIDFNKGIAIVTVTGAVIGAPVGAYVGYRGCSG